MSEWVRLESLLIIEKGAIKILYIYYYYVHLLSCLRGVFIFLIGVFIVPSPKIDFFTRTYSAISNLQSLGRDTRYRGRSKESLPVAREATTEVKATRSIASACRLLSFDALIVPFCVSSYRHFLSIWPEFTSDRVRISLDLLLGSFIFRLSVQFRKENKLTNCRKISHRPFHSYVLLR